MNKSTLEYADFYNEEENVFVKISKLPDFLVARSLIWNRKEGTGGLVILVPLLEEAAIEAQNAAREVQSAVREHSEKEKENE